MVRVLVIAESAERANIVREGLTLAGHDIAQVTSPDSPLLSIDQTQPDAIVLQSHSPSLDLLDRIIDAMGNKSLPLVIFSDDSSEQAIGQAVRAGAAAYIVDGLKASRVPTILHVALARHEFMSEIRAELNAAQQKLAERKFVERAKGLLMKARGLSEDEAYHTLRRMAMERNRRMGDVAKSVIEMADLLN
jgi:two-component system, response regulator / RNA-binding antiterminator